MGPEIAAAVAAAGQGAAATAPAWLTPTVSGALMAGGTAAQMLAARQQRKEQQSILNRALDVSDRTTRQGTADIIGNAQTQQGGQAQLGAVQQAQEQAAQRTMADLKGAGADLIDTAAGSGNQSAAFLAAKADRALSEGNRMTAIAREAAKVRAPGMVQTDNAMARGDLAERMASAQASSRARAQAAQLDANDVEAPLYGQLGQIASMVGTLGMMAPAGAAAAEGINGAATLGVTGPNGAFTGEVPVTAGGGGISSLARALPAAGMFTPRRGAWAGR